jgi:hypothetical protein
VPLSDRITKFEQDLNTTVNGLRNFLPRGTKKLTLEGAPTPVSDLIRLFEDGAADWKTVRDLSAALTKALAKRNGQTKALGARRDSLRTCLDSLLGKSNPVLVEFAFKPKKERRQLTTDELAARKQKAAATRAARHTLGKRQKQKITGSNGTQAPRVTAT